MSSSASNLRCKICRCPHDPQIQTAWTQYHIGYAGQLQYIWFCQVPEYPRWGDIYDWQSNQVRYYLSRKNSYLLRIAPVWSPAVTTDKGILMSLQAYHYDKPGSVIQTMQKRVMLIKEIYYDTFDTKDEALKELRENALSYLTVAHL